MKTAYLIAALAVASTLSVCVSEGASPAATQDWTKDYVRTNTAQSASSKAATDELARNVELGMSAAMKILADPTNVINKVERAIDAMHREIYPQIGALIESNFSVGL